MNQQAKNLNCILNILNEDINSCNRKNTCLRPDECQIRDALQVLLKIPNRFSKAILIIIDMQAEIYQYLDYIGAKGVTDPKKGFTNEQCNAMFKHYGVDEEGKPGKACSISKGMLYDIYKNYKNGKRKSKLLDFNKSDDTYIQKAFHGEKAVGRPIPWGSDIVPVLILFLKNNVQNGVKYVKKFVEDKERSLKIRLIIKNTRMESLGKLVSSIPAGDKPENDPRGKFSRWLLGWLEERDGLWLGNKIWFVVDHCLVHAKNLWKLANDLAKEANLGENLSKLTADKMSPLIFSLAIWLHDIGYKGIHLPDWNMNLMNTRRLDHIINAHSVISAALILKRNCSYNLNEFKEDILALAGLVCAYHQKGCPITQQERSELQNYEIPDQLKLDNKFSEEIINKSRITNSCKEYLILDTCILKESPVDVKNNPLKVMASLLRFLDSCDFNRNRVGSPAMKKLRESVCEDNVSPLIKDFTEQLNKCYVKVEEKINTNDDNKVQYGEDYKKLKNLKEANFIPSEMKDENLKILTSLKGLFTNIQDQEIFDNTFFLGRYVGLLNQQIKYYEVHNFVTSVSFKKTENEKENDLVDLEYKVDKGILSKHVKIKLSNVAEKEIKNFISKKAKVVYEDILKENILKIRNVKLNNVTKDFYDWIKK